MEVVEKHALLDDALAEWSAALGRDRRRYSGHAYRVFNFSRRILGTSSDDDVLAAASALHDIGIWSDGTFDYLPPSVARAREYLARKTAISVERVTAAIDNHHVVLPIHGDGLVEAFRLADSVDVSAGLTRAGLDRAFVREVYRLFPLQGFHAMLARTAAAWFVRHPLRPMPMMRWRGAVGPR
jgi:hypothetical protein